jgi:hypothetical protein
VSFQRRELLKAPKASEGVSFFEMSIKTKLFLPEKSITSAQCCRKFCGQAKFRHSVCHGGPFQTHSTNHWASRFPPLSSGTSFVSYTIRQINFKISHGVLLPVSNFLFSDDTFKLSEIVLS